MKKVVWALLAALLVMVVGGVAQAVDTNGYVAPPDKPVVESHVTGASTVNAQDPRDVTMMAAEKAAVDAAIDKAIDAADGKIVQPAYVALTFTGIGAVSYALDADEYIYDFASKNFKDGMGSVAVASVSAKAAGMLTLAQDYLEPSTATATSGSILVVRKTNETPKSSSGGCSTMTMGALALFMLPILAVKRGKK